MRTAWLALVALVIVLGTVPAGAQPAGTLVVGLVAEPVNLDPAQVTDLNSNRVGRRVVETLVTFPEESTQIVPGLAESWTVSKDGGRIHDKAISEYRKSYESRHKILESFMPFWRSVDRNIAEVNKKLGDLQESAKGVDALMAKYEAINAKTDKAQHALTVSAFTQFAIALLVMAVAAGGAFINYKLIALPMSEMVGAGDYLTASLRTSEVAALVIIFVEASMGLFLMEALRITHLFPRIATLSDHMRRRMMWIALVLLVTLAGVEAALALMRDMLIADKQALIQSLATVQQAAPADGWVGKIPTAGQMLLGFILPFALAFIAIPVESLIHSERTVGGVLLAALVSALALTLRVLANVVRRMSKVLITVYDVVIVLPLMAERLTKAGMAMRHSAVDADDTAYKTR